MDTLGAWWSVLYREVSSFQRLRKRIWDIAKCPQYRGVLISGVSFKRGSTVKWFGNYISREYSLFIPFCSFLTDCYIVHLLNIPLSTGPCLFQAIAAWFLYALNRRRKTERYARASERYRHRLLTFGVTQWIKVRVDASRAKNKALGLAGQAEILIGHPYNLIQSWSNFWVATVENCTDSCYFELCASL